MGRSGSTLFYESVAEKISSYIAIPFWNKEKKGAYINFIRDPRGKDLLSVNTIFKTHCLAGSIPDNVKVVYLYSNPMNVAMSSQQLGEAHYRNLFADYTRHHEWKEDVLRLGDNYYGYMKPQSFDLMTIRYESMFDNVGHINAFLGIEITLQQKDRKTDWRKHPDADTLYRTYGKLYEDMIRRDNIIIWKRQ